MATFNDLDAVAVPLWSFLSAKELWEGPRCAAKSTCASVMQVRSAPQPPEHLTAQHPCSHNLPLAPVTRLLRSAQVWISAMPKAWATEPFVLCCCECQAAVALKYRALHGLSCVTLWFICPCHSSGRRLDSINVPDYAGFGECALA